MLQGMLQLDSLKTIMINNYDCFVTKKGKDRNK